MNLYVDIEKQLNGFFLKTSFEANDASSLSTGLLGASGSGKSLTLRCIAGIETPTKGIIRLNDRVLFDSQKGINVPIRDRKIGYLFQNYALFPNMTVEKNIHFAIKNSATKSVKNQFAKNVKNETLNYLKLMKLEGNEKKYPHQLSGGQQQRVALARILASKPELLLLDEPFSALDDYLKNVLIKDLTELLNSFGGMSILVSHNIDEVYRLCEQLVVLSKGSQEAFDNKKEIFRKPQTVEVARLTGCKNITKVCVLSDSEIFLEKWDVKFRTNDLVKQSITHFGIRANHIQFAENKLEENCLECVPENIIEAPFRVTVHLALLKKDVEGKYKSIQWELDRERWEEIKNRPIPWKIQLKPEFGMLLS